MNTDDFFKTNYLTNIINENYKIKKENISIINSFKRLYDITRTYSNEEKSYDEIISDPDSRVEFLIKSVQIALTSETMDNETRNIIIQMYSSLYEYLTSESKLKEIEIPNEVKEKMFKKNFMPSSEQIVFLMNLIRQNKKIYEEEFDGKDFSQTFNDGLHRNITEVLSIQKENLPHILGLTSKESSLFEFYKKSTIMQKLKKKINIEKFIKVIGWEYKDPEENELTDEEVLLNESYDMMPKIKTLDFYTNNDNIIELINENTKVCNFTYKYIRNKMFIKKYEKKGERQEILKKFTKEEISLIMNKDIDSNNKEIRKILDRFVENKELAEITGFQDEFIKEFGYSYPLIEYNKLLAKNIGFYNFSLFENLNSIIVDYKPQGEINSDVFLVSYSQSEMKKQNEHSNKIIKEDRLKYEKIASEGVNGQAEKLDNDYLQLLQSLVAFPPEERYYFRQMRVIPNEKNDKSEKKYIPLEEKHNKKVLDRNVEKKENIFLIGFATKPEEQERINKMETGEIRKFEHHHYCETNESTNYFQYQTEWLKNGIEYPINTIVEPQSKKVLKLSRYIDNLKYSIKEFNEYKYNKSENIEYSINYEKHLIKDIIRKLDNYEYIKELNVNLQKLKKVKTYNQLDYDKEELKIIHEYNKQMKNYLYNYINILDENLIIDNKKDLGGKRK